MLDRQEPPTQALGVAALAVLLLVGGFGVGTAQALAGTEGSSPSVWTQEQHVTRNDRGGFFGSEIALDNDTLVVSTQPNRNPLPDGADRAYVYHRDSTGKWIQTARLTPPDARSGDTFGYSLAVDDEADVLLVGNPAAQELHVYRRSVQGSWAHASTLSGTSLHFGAFVAVDGDQLLVSGIEPPVYRYEDTGSGWQRVAVYDGLVGDVDIEGDVFVARSVPNVRTFNVYREQDGAWALEAKLEPPSAGTSGAPFAEVIDLSQDGKTVVFGSPTQDLGVGIDGHQPLVVPSSGSAWVYERAEGDWFLTGDFENPDPGMYEMFGNDVGVSDDRIVVGAPTDSLSGAKYAGAAYVYEAIDGDWRMTTKLKNSDGTAYGSGDWLGESVAIEGSLIAVGALFDDNRRDGSPPPFADQGDVPPCLHRTLVWGCDHGENDGSVYVFERLDSDTVTLGGEI